MVQLTGAGQRHVRGKGNLRAEFKRSQDELSRLNRRIENGFKNLLPWTGSVEDLEKLSVPQTVIVEQYRHEFADLKDSKKEIAAEEERLQVQINLFILLTPFPLEKKRRQWRQT